MKAVKLIILGCLVVGAVSCSEDDNGGYIPPGTYSEVFDISSNEWTDSEAYPGGWEYWVTDEAGIMPDIYQYGAVLVYMNLGVDGEDALLPYTIYENQEVYQNYVFEDGILLTVEPIGETAVARPGNINCKIVYLEADDLYAQGLSKEEVKTMSLKEVESRFDIKTVNK